MIIIFPTAYVMTISEHAYGDDRKLKKGLDMKYNFCIKHGHVTFICEYTLSIN